MQLQEMRYAFNAMIVLSSQHTEFNDITDEHGSLLLKIPIFCTVSDFNKQLSGKVSFVFLK